MIIEASVMLSLSKHDEGDYVASVPFIGHRLLRRTLVRSVLY